MRWLSLIAIVFVNSWLLSIAQTVEFTILGYDRQPPAKAAVVVADWWDDTVVVRYTTTGKLQLTLPSPGMYRLRIGATYHTPMDFSYLFLPEEQYQFELRLRPLQPQGEDPQIIGDFNNFNFRTARPLKKVGEKRYRITLPVTDTLVRYQVVDNIDGMRRSFNGTQSDDYEFDGYDFISVLYPPSSDSITITVDYRQYPVGNFSAHKTVTTTVPMAVDTVVRRFHRLLTAVTRQIMQGQTPTLSCQQLMDSVFGRVAISADPRLPLLRAAIVLIFHQLDVVSADECPNGTDSLLPLLVGQSPSSWVWSFNDRLLFAMEQWMDSVPDLRLRLTQVALLHPRSDVRQMALLTLIRDAHRQQQISLLRDLIRQFRHLYGSSGIAAFVIEQYDPDNPIAVGKPVPDFHLVDLDDTATVYTPETFRGQYVLLDFWATWCGPCRMELPYLHEAYERFRDRNFTILSISFDASPDVVRKFRTAPKTPMPWHHSFADKGFQSDIAQAFRVRGIPKPILVDPTGKIIAVQSDLRGRRLLETLDRILPHNRYNR